MKVSELTGEKLAYWVARAQGWRVETLQDVIIGPEEVWVSGTTKLEAAVGGYRPDINWSQCGELIEKFKIDVCFNEMLSIFECRWSVGDNWISGTTPQETVCRAAVASVYGDEVSDEN